MTDLAADLQFRINETIEVALARANADVVCRCDEERDGPTDDWFDRSICPEPCGTMHTICSECGRTKGHCPVAAASLARRRTALTVAVGSLRAHSPASAANNLFCLGCHACLDIEQDEMPWPCADALTAAAVVDPALLSVLPLPAWVSAESLLLFPDPKRANRQPPHHDDDRG